MNGKYTVHIAKDDNMFFSMEKFKCGTVNLIKKALADDILALSSQLAYSFLLSFFPFLIFLMTIVGYSDIKTSDIMDAAKFIIPSDAYALANRTVAEVARSKNGGLLSISLILTIWSASSGFNAVIKGLNKAYNENEWRGILRVELISIGFTFALAIVIMFSVFLLIFGETNTYFLVKWFGLPEEFKLLWNVGRYVVTVIIMVIVFALVYRFAPCKRHRWIDVMPGALFASLGWIISSLCFSFYISNFGSYSRLYGSIGAVIILMLWLLITAIIVILGGEINSVLLKHCK